MGHFSPLYTPYLGFGVLAFLKKFTNCLSWALLWFCDLDHDQQNVAVLVLQPGLSVTCQIPTKTMSELSIDVNTHP